MDTTQIELSFDAPPPAVEVDWKSKVPSVSQLTRKIRGHIENTFFDVWVKGEISNFKKPVSGHAYFTLKDATAQLRAVMFRQAISKVKCELKDGMEILLHGTITVYEARGDYQIIADALEPVGVGALQLAFEQLKKKLHQEGLFDPAKKVKLPFLPKRIGVVTSATGAAIRDILKVLGRRFPNLEVLIIPSNVQGEKAAPEIVNGIRLAEEWNLQNPQRKIEAMIVGRGGGSLEDLWPFNEEIVARAIFACKIPIISAVGHEIDFTIADFVADLRAPTPSAAAEIIVPKLEELQYVVETQRSKMLQLMKKHIQQMRLHLTHLSQRIQDPKEKIAKIKERIGVLENRLKQSMQTILLLRRKKIENYAQMLNSLSPLAVVGRGFSLTTNGKGDVIREISQLKIGEEISVQVASGTIISEVKNLIAPK